ncbi:hypothetical protein MRX96_052143 [Rhipicephalus microplus]
MLLTIERVNDGLRIARFAFQHREHVFVFRLLFPPPVPLHEWMWKPGIHLVNKVDGESGGLGEAKASSKCRTWHPRYVTPELQRQSGRSYFEKWQSTVPKPTVDPVA